MLTHKQAIQVKETFSGYKGKTIILIMSHVDREHERSREVTTTQITSVGIERHGSCSLVLLSLDGYKERLAVIEKPKMDGDGDIYFQAELGECLQDVTISSM